MIFRRKSKKEKPLVAIFLANFYVDWSWNPKPCSCGIKVWSALCVDGVAIPSCGGAECNRKAIAQRKAM